MLLRPFSNFLFCSKEYRIGFGAWAVVLLLDLAHRGLLVSREVLLKEL